MSGPQEAGQTPFSAWLSAIVPAVIPSDAALARAVGAPQSTVLGWKRGARPSTKYVLKLADLIPMDAGALLRIAEYKKED